MRFYDRQNELAIFQRNWEKTESQSLFTVLVGRRRIGKTSLLFQREKEHNMLYLYVLKDNEHVLVEKFQNFLKVNDAIPGHIQEIWDRYHNAAKVS